MCVVCVCVCVRTCLCEIYSVRVCVLEYMVYEVYTQMCIMIWVLQRKYGL